MKFRDITERNTAFIAAVEQIMELDFSQRIDVNLSQDIYDKTAVEIDNIYAWKQRQGWGTEAMTVICTMADDYKVTLTLAVANNSDDFFSEPGDPNEEALIDFYSLFGFKIHPSMTSRTLMIRTVA